MEEKYSINNYSAEVEILPAINVAMVFTDFQSSMAGDPRAIEAERTARNGEKANLIVEAEFNAEDPNEEWNQNAHAWYGTDNLFPQNIYKIIKQNSKLKVGLGSSARDLIGFGIEAGQYDYDSDEKHFKPSKFVEFDRFYDRANVFRNYIVPAARYLKTYYMVFVSVMLTESGDRVASLKAIANKKCRLSKDGKFCYVSSHWDKGLIDMSDQGKVKTVPVIDSFFDTAEELRSRVKSGKAREFMYVVRFPTEEDIYSLADWVSVVEQGWVDVSNDVPNFKRWLLKNLTTINQIMYVSEDYFKDIYPDWGKLKKQCAGDQKNLDDTGTTAFAELKRRRQLLVTDIQDKLKGSKKAGSLITVPLLKSVVGNQVVESKAITIETITGNDYTGKYNADANEADAQILFALGIDPARYGNLTRTDSQGGTGKREGHNIAQASEFVFEQLLLEPLYFKRDYDKIPAESEMQFRIRRSVTPTLDKITPSQREINPIA